MTTPVTAYCSAIETAASNYLATGPTDFAHLLALIALMGLPSSYRMAQRNILSKADSNALQLDSIRRDLLNEEWLLARENKHAEKVANAMQVQKYKKGTHKSRPRSAEEKAPYAEWLETAVCRNCKEFGHIERWCPRKSSTGKTNRANQVTSSNTR